MQTLRRQFPVSEGYCEVFKTNFKFTNQEREIQIKYEKKGLDEWMLGLQSTDKVCVTNA